MVDKKVYPKEIFAHRQNLIKFLNENNIYSWVGDCEGKIDLELFIFNNTNEIEKLIEFKGVAIRDDPKLYEYDYFKHVKIIYNPAVIRTNSI